MAHLVDVDLEQQVEDLRRELSRLKHSVSRRGSRFYDDASETVSDYFGELSRWVVPSLLGWRSRARAVERAAYDNPAVIAGVGLVIVGLVASLLISRRMSRPTARRSRPAAEADDETRGRGRNRPRGNRARTGRNSRASA